MHIKSEAQKIDRMVKCIDFSKHDHRHKGFTKILLRPFKAIALFFSRLDCLFRYRRWLDNEEKITIEAKRFLNYYIYEADPSLKTNKLTKKILKIAKKLNLSLNKKKLSLNLDKLSTAINQKTFSLLNDKLLFHIHGDEFGSQNKNLEGYQTQKTLEYLTAYLNERKEQGLSCYGLDDKAFNEINNALTLTKTTDFIAKAQELLDTNENVLIPGGWVGSPSGHAMLFEVIPEGGNKATFRIYNLGAGSNHHTTGVVGAKVKACPYLDLKGVDRRRLKEKNVLLAIHEMNKHLRLPYTGNKTEYNEKDIYIGLKELLNPVSEESGEERLMTLQRAGICSWRSLLAFLATRMEKKEYKQFKIDIKLKTLVDKVHQFQSYISIPEAEEYRLVKKSYVKLCRKIEHAYEKKIVGDKYISQAEKDLRGVALWLEDRRDRSYKPLQEPPANKLEWTTHIMSTEESPSLPLHEQVKGKVVEAGTGGCEDLVHKLKNASLDKVIVECEKAFAKGLYQEVHLAITKYVETMDQKEDLVELGKLSKIFFDTCFLVPQSDKIHPERLYVLLKIFEIQKMLLEPKLSKHEYWSYGYLSEENRRDLLFLNLTDAKQNKEFSSYTQSKPMGSSYDLYEFQKLNRYGESSTLHFRNEYKSNNLNGLAGHMHTLFPDIHKKLSESPQYNDLPLIGQSARIFTSGLLPEWFKGVRDTYLSIHYLANEPVGYPTNGAKNFSFNFDYKDKMDYWNNPVTDIRFYLKEIHGDILKEYPEQARVRESCKHRFDWVYRPMSSDRMKKLINTIVDITYYNEKDLLEDHATNHNLSLSDEHFKELSHLFLGKNLGVTETFEYFYSHPEKFRDPDYQVIFQLLFFSKNNLHKEMQIPKFASLLNGFMCKQLSQAMAENEIQTMVFILHMQRLFRGYSAEFKDTLPQLRKILTLKGLEADEKSIIYAEIAATLCKKEELSLEDHRDLLIATAYLEVNPAPPKWTCPDTNKAARDALYIHSASLREKLSELVDDVFHELREGEEAKGWNKIENEGEFPYFESSDGLHLYFPLNGQLISKNSPKVNLPKEIGEHPYIRQVFDSVSSARWVKKGIYELTDERGFQTYVQLHKGDLLIEQKRNGEWYRFIPRNAFMGSDETCFLSSRHLAQNFHHWRSLRDPSKIELQDPGTGIAKYEVQLDGSRIERVIEIDTGFNLSNPSHSFKRFESPHYIQEWFSKDSLKLAKVELPRLSLSFVPNNGKLTCPQFDGYFISKEQYAPMLGSYSNYLILENKEGIKKVLLPHQQFEYEKEDKESLLPLFNIDRKDAVEDNIKQPFFVYDVKQEDGTLLNKGLEANLYLASVLTIVQEYEAAAYYLKKYGTKLSPYSKGEAEAVLSITKAREITGDSSGNGLSLQLAAFYLVMKNRTDHNQTIDDKLIEKVHNSYSDYLCHYHHTTVAQLTKEEELFLLKYLLSREFTAIFFNRLRTLDPEGAKNYLKPEVEKKCAAKEAPILSFVQILSKEIYQPKRDGISPPSLNQVLLSRINATLSQFPWYFYETLISGSNEDKQFLKDAFMFGKHTAGAAYSALFETILEHPNSFPQAIPNDEGGQYKWWDKVLKKADELHTGKLEKLFEVPEPNIIKDFTPNSFNLDPNGHDYPTIELCYSLKQVPMLKADCFNKTEVKDKNGHELQNWMQNEADQPINSESLYKMEIERLIKDLETYRNNVTNIKYELKDIRIVEKILNEQITDLKPLQAELLKLANAAPEKAVDKHRKKLAMEGQLQREITLDDLFVSFAKQDPQSLLILNPILNSDAINTLYQKTGEYLLYATREQQRKRAWKTLNSLNKAKKEERDHYVQQLAEGLTAERSYEPKNHPAYLVFEFYADILMRQNQVEKLALFTEKGDSNLVMEMIMGSGKSKVLLPLLGLLRADGDTISMMIVPQSLFESVSSDTQNILAGAFSQSLKSLQFDRNTVFTPESLGIILEDLKNVQRNKGCLIMTSKSIQCLILKFIEEGIKGTDSETFKLMQKIINLLAEKGYPIIDEADTILNILHEVSYSLGDKISPDPTEITVISEIYKILYTDPEIRATARLESDPNSNPKSVVLTEQLYREKVMLLIAKKWVESMKGAEFDSKELTRKVTAFFLKANKQDIIAYLCHQPEAQAFFDQQDPEIQDILALAGEEISNLLPHTLTRTCEEKYGLDLEGISAVAIPFIAANTPSKGSLFANPYITMNYTFQYYIKKGIQKELVIKEIQRLQNVALSELKEAGTGMTIEETRAWKIFQQMRQGTDIPLFNYKEKQLDILTKAINSSEKAIRGIVSKNILPQLDLFSHKLSCNPHNLIALFKKVNGFTGTLWNSNSMTSKLTPLPEPGTDAKTLNILWENSRNEVMVINEGSPENMLKQVNGISYDMISDAGGYFKEGGNAVIAKMLSNKKKRPVVFFNNNNELAETNGNSEILFSESTTPIENRDTFLDQRHTTGTDVKQKPDAVGLVTIGNNMLLRDLLQSVWRLRGLASSQRVKFVVSADVKAIICQTLKLNASTAEIKFDDILRFCILNQVSQQGKDNFETLRKELMSLTQKILLDIFTSSNQTHHKKASEHLKQDWVKLSVKKPRELYGKVTTKEDSPKVLKGVLKMHLDYIDNIYKELPFLDGKEDILRQVKGIVERLQELLPEKVLSPLRDTDEDQTVEVEQEQQQETETELEVVDHQQGAKVALGYVENFSAYSQEKINKLDNQIFERSFHTTYFSLELCMQQDPKLQEYSELFEGIYLTINVPEWPKDNPRVSDLKLLGSHRTPFHFLKFVENDVIVLDHNDASMQKDKDLYNISFGHYDQTRKVTPEVARKVAKVKFLNGQSSFSKVELGYLKEWISEHGKEKMLELYQKHILAGYPEKAAAFSNSNLRELFKNL